MATRFKKPNRQFTSICAVMVPLTSCQDKVLALLAPLCRGGDMLVGLTLALISNPIYISYLLFMATTWCVATGGGE